MEFLLFFYEHLYTGRSEKLEKGAYHTPPHPLPDLPLTLVDLRGASIAPLSWVQILSISCSLWKNLARSYVGAPGGWRSRLQGFLDLPLTEVWIIWLYLIYIRFWENVVK